MLFFACTYISIEGPPRAARAHWTPRALHLLLTYSGSSAGLLWTWFQSARKDAGSPRRRRLKAARGDRRNDIHCAAAALAWGRARSPQQAWQGGARAPERRPPRACRQRADLSLAALRAAARRAPPARPPPLRHVCIYGGRPSSSYALAPTLPYVRRPPSVCACPFSPTVPGAAGGREVTWRGDGPRRGRPAGNAARASRPAATADREGRPDA